MNQFFSTKLKEDVNTNYKLEWYDFLNKFLIKMMKMIKIIFGH